MRDLLIVSLVAVIMPLVLRWPHVGILAFTWISIMNPHRLTFGFAYNLPYALLFFALTAAIWLVSKERKLPPFVIPTWALLIFTLWLTYTTFHAWLPEPAFQKFDRTSKIILGAALTCILIDRRERVIQLVWVICLSLGFYGVKGGLFTILTGGDNRVWGAPDSFMEDNNALALSLVMVTPLMFFLFLETKHRVIRLGIMAMIVLTLLSVIGTYSRGGLLAMAGMGMLLWFRSKHKALSLIAVLIVGMVASAYVPSEWVQRMATIKTFTEDESFQSRIRSWTFALEVAEESPTTGGGFRVFQLNTYEKKGERGWLNAHSIYFEVLGEHGYVGLALFLFLIFSCFFYCSYIMARSKLYPDYEWSGNLASAIQVSIAGYAIGGAALNMAFFDLFYFVVALVISVAGIVRAHEMSLMAPRTWVLHSAWNSSAPASNTRIVGRPTVRAG